MENTNEPPSIADYYGDLGVSQSATRQQIRKAYKSLALTTHPDKQRNKSADAADFRRVKEACDYLLDPTKRAEYDKKYLDIQVAWARYKQKQEAQREHEERRAAEEQAESERKAAEEQAERERKAAKAEWIRKREEQRRAAEEKAHLEKLREQKTRQAEERSREAARRAWDDRQRAAKERIRQERVAEAERKSEEAAARMRVEQEQAALERLQAAQIEEKLNAARCRWREMREACESSSSGAAPRRSSPIRSTACAHPKFQWPKRKGQVNCIFCKAVRKKWAFSCPECGASACPECMQKFWLVIVVSVVGYLPLTPRTLTAASCCSHGAISWRRGMFEADTDVHNDDIG
ncbi:hypothetical protein F5Y19DRAFT_491555 [Xylariaceae sp. FL1651]|nr:hypothetical protein F5Y19DRAFT_491555 [Xylariaceae sp. FL1651]